MVRFLGVGIRVGITGQPQEKKEGVGIRSLEGVGITGQPQQEALDKH